MIMRSGVVGVVWKLQVKSFSVYFLVFVLYIYCTLLSFVKTISVLFQLCFYYSSMKLCFFLLVNVVVRYCND